jgi:hypothetical protein
LRLLELEVELAIGAGLHDLSVDHEGLEAPAPNRLQEHRVLGHRDCGGERCVAVRGLGLGFRLGWASGSGSGGVTGSGAGRGSLGSGSRGADELGLAPEGVAQASAVQQVSVASGRRNMDMRVDDNVSNSNSCDISS